MTRGTKFGGGTLALAVVCLLAWYALRNIEGVWLIGRFFRLGARRFAAANAVPSPRMVGLPNVYLWAWERPEDMKFLGERKVGVAFLAKTIYVKSIGEEPGAGGKADVLVRPRMQPLRIVPGTPLMAVVRIETLAAGTHSAYRDAARPAVAFSEALAARIAGEIVETTNFPGVSGVQIDFDATLSEHNFYKGLLVEVRKRLPNAMPLSITALASWCIGDRWLEQLPPGTIDEAVPMLFRMGQGGMEVTHYLASGNSFTVSSCTTSLGLSTDEPFSRDILSGKFSIGDNPLKNLRVYSFSPQVWTEPAASPVLEELAR
jgi:hypothetical protein